MKIVDMFDAVRDGTYDDFIKLYTGGINALHKYSGFNLLQLAGTGNSNLEEKIKKCVAYTILFHDKYAL